MMMYPAVHYTMGGLWVDYNLMSTIPGLFILGEANFSDHGANRLGASALMQGLADGYFIIPYTMGDYLAQIKPHEKSTDAKEFQEARELSELKIKKLLSINGKKTTQEFHRTLGKLLWDTCGMSRNENGLKEALHKIPELREEFWKNLNVTGNAAELNQTLEYANRVADYLEFAETLVIDALHRKESCGGHFREESQDAEGEAKRDDTNYTYVAAWEFQGIGKEPTLHKEELKFTEVELAQRSYK
jgi:succinate dehydrogenase / fumarate reductase flavoprotein subunit